MRVFTAFFIIIVCLAKPVTAQVVVKEGNLFLQEDGKVSIQGDVVNHGNIVNQGTLSLTGDWQNYSSYTSSAGTMALIGLDPQLFSHNGQTVSILYIANPSSINMPTDVKVENKLILKEGVVMPGDRTNLILAEEANVEGGAANTYIHGKMYHTGTGRKFYPVGKNGHYAPVTLSQVRGENPLVGVEFYDRAVQALEGNGMLLQEFYWNLSSLSGTFEGSPLTLEVLLENPVWEDDQFVVAGSDHMDAPFEVLDEANVHIQGNRSIFSSNEFIRSQFITLGIRKGIKETFYLPNALSPSAPHPEDQTVKIYSKTVKPDGFQWTIWNNWGQVVYTTNSYEQASSTGWQGTHKGKGDAQPGIYKYFLQGTFNSGQTFSQKGTIVLYK